MQSPIIVEEETAGRALRRSLSFVVLARQEGAKHSNIELFEIDPQIGCQTSLSHFRLMQHETVRNDLGRFWLRGGVES